MEQEATCACHGCNELAIEGRDYCAYCEDHHYHTHGDPDGKPIVGRPRFKQYDTFQLVRPTEDDAVPQDCQGVVLLVLGGVPCQYEVEFPDGHGGNLGRTITYTLSEDQMARIQ